MNLNKITRMAYIAFMAVIIAVCSQICFPSVVPFTFQTFAILCAIELMGAKNGFFVILLYIGMGMVGLPVFSGMQAGVGTLVGTGGGYIIGFCVATALYWMLEKRIHKNVLRALWLITDHALGAVWYKLFYAPQSDFWQIILICVVPFVIPDIIKMMLAVYVAKKLRREE